MMTKRGRKFAIVSVALLYPCVSSSAQVAVKYREGVVHGFLALRTLHGETLADGDLTQVTSGGRVTTDLVFHFKDGSFQEETSVFSQSGTFRLLSNHLVQKGSTFKRPMDVSIDSSRGEVTVRYEDDGNQKVISELIKLPPDLANGIVSIVLKNIPPGAPKTVLPMIVATPKPRLVKLVISPEGDEPFSIAGSVRKATRYVVKVDLGAAAGLVAPLVGKQPPDTLLWILEDKAPAFLKTEGPLFEDGPVVRIELTSPVWP